MGEVTPEQLTLRGVPAPRRRRTPPPPVPAEVDPVARVLLDSPVPHLDRPFDYLVPATMAADARPGVRVRVRLGGRDLTGFLVERVAASEHTGVLQPLRAVVSAEPVLTPPVLALSRAVAERWAGTVADVLRLAVPPRHQATEREVWPQAGARANPAPDPVPWEAVPGGSAFLRRLSAGEAPRAVWQALPGPGDRDWAAAVAAAVVATVAGGRGALVVVPSLAGVTRVTAALDQAGVPGWAPGSGGGWVRLHAEDGPAARYRAFLATVRGAAEVVVGTRSAAFAPVARLGLAVCWDDGDPLHQEPRAPYPHAREVLALRARLEDAALLVGGHSRSVAAARWLATDWARPLVAPRATVRAMTPRVRALTSVELAAEGAAAGARLPATAWRAARDALGRGPVLVQVPRAGYVPVVACATCREPARCRACQGPLRLEQAGTARCGWCGETAAGWACPHCRGTGFRAVRVGSQRTAEELGQAFPGVVVRTSGAATGIIEQVGSRPQLVVATPGAEPRAEGGYAAALLLDAAVLTGRPALDVGEQALRTWLAAAALVRPAGEGGQVLLVGDGAPVPTQALVRWDPGGHADRELAEREEIGLPPAAHLAVLTGPRDAVTALLDRLGLPDDAVVLGPVAVGEPAADQLDPEATRAVRALIRSPWARGPGVARALRAGVAARSAGGLTAVHVRLEPTEV